MKKIFTLLLLSSFTPVSEAQIIKTSLTLTVRDELGNTVEGATVMLFENDADYASEKNAVAEGITDKKGVIKFKDIKSVSFLVIARKGDKDNSGGGEQIGKLEANKFNKATIVIQ